MKPAIEKDIALRDLPKIFRRRRRLFLGTTAALLALGIAACIFMTRRYQATGVIQLQKSTADSLGLNNMMNSEGGDSAAEDTLSLNIDLQTQKSLLESDTLALQVINELGLEQNKDFKGHFSPISWAMGIISPAGISDPPNASLADSPARRRRLLQAFSKRLKVTVAPGTRLIQISFSNRDPKVAAAVVNHLIQALIDFSFRTRFMATKQVSGWLEGQLSDLRKQSESLNGQVVALQQNSGIFGVGASDLNGKPVVDSPALDRLQGATTALSQAETNRVLKEAVYQVAKTGDAELISQLSGTSGTSPGSGIANSLMLIQSLRAQEATLQSQIDQDASRYGPAYPKLIQEREAYKGVQQSIQEEIARVAARAKNDYEVALKAEEGARAAYETDKQAAERLNNKGIEYAILSKEASQSQDLYQDLLKRLKEAGVLEGLHSSNITVVDEASPPSNPSSPNVPVYLGIALLAGMVLGCVACLVVDATDDRIQDLEQLEAMNLPLLGFLPRFERQTSAPAPMHMEPYSSGFSEAVTIIRSNLLISHRNDPPQVILVTSAWQAEGKSVLAFSLAASLCQTGKQVLLIEGDMRNPVMSQRIGLEGETSLGLSALLSDGSMPTTTISMQDSPNLKILTSGATPSRPAELLSSQRLQSLVEEWKKDFDFIVIDSPPVLPVADTQFIESLADATAVVVRSGYTARNALRRTYATLSKHAKDPQNPHISVVLNFVPPQSAEYFYGGKDYSQPA